MSFLALLWWLKHPEALAAGPKELLKGETTPGNRKAMALFMGGAAIAFWMHYTALMLVGCALTIGVLLVISAAPAGKRVVTALNFALMGLPVLLLWTPCILFLSYVLGPVKDDGALHTPNIIELGFSFDYLFGPGLTSAIDRAHQSLPRRRRNRALRASRIRYLLRSAPGYAWHCCCFSAPVCRCSRTSR